MNTDPKDPSTNVLIAGAGYLGTEIARLLLTRQQSVTGLVKSSASAERLRALGVETICSELPAPSGSLRLPDCRGVVICLAPDQGDEDSYRRTYLDAVASVLKAVRAQARPERIVYVSSTGVWRDRRGKAIAEDSEPDGESEKSRILAEAEKRVLGSGLPVVVLRLAGIYGPGRNRLGQSRRPWPEGRQPDRVMNLIHVEDAARACLYLLTRGNPGTCYSGVDTEPVRSSVFYAWLAAETGREPAAVTWDAELPAGKRCAADRLKELSFEWKYPTFREGYQSLIKETGEENLPEGFVNHAGS